MGKVELKEDKKTTISKKRKLIFLAALLPFTVIIAFTIPDYLFIGRFITKYHNLNDMALYSYGSIMLSRGNPRVYNPQFFNAFYRGAPEIQKVHKGVSSLFSCSD